jgi:DNA-binding response OmpR family regulator
MEPIISEVVHPNFRVLLVEDDPECAELICAQIRNDGNSPFRVEWSDTLRKAMSRLAWPGIDVVLLDLGMPEQSGHKTHSAIISMVGKRVPVVILTSDDSDCTRESTLEMGAARYLVKGHVSPSELRQALLETADSHH